MTTPIFQNKLQLFVEANELAGANDSEVSSFTDLSLNARHLVAASAKPLIKTNAINSKKSVIWNGSKNPLVYSGTFTIRCGFLLVKCDGNFGGDFKGVLSSPENFGILAGIGGSGIFYDFQYNFYEYRLNDRIYPKEIAPAPISSWGIIYFKFWQNLTVDGVQLGQDRDDTDSKFDGEIALMALYDRDFCEKDVRSMTRSIANSYQLALPDVFPFQGSKGDSVTIGKRLLSDGQDEPVTRVKRGARKLFDLNFTDRHQSERVAANSFWNEFYPSKRFIYRDYQNIPPVDTICRFPENSEFQYKGGLTVNSNAYGFQVFESVVAPATAIPSAPVIPDELVPDTTAPSVPTDLEVEMVSASRIDGSFTASGDDVAVTHYRLRRATNSIFTTGVVDTDLGTSTTFSVTGLSPTTEYFFKVLAEDAAMNQSNYSVSANATTDTPPPIIIEYDLDEQSFSNADPVGTLADSSGNAFNATNATSNKPVFKTDDGNYLLFTSIGGVINYLNIPDYTSLIGSQAQIYLVFKLGSSATKFGRFLGESNIGAAFSEIFSNNLYEPFATTARKDNKVPVPLLTAGFCVYRVVSRNGYYDMSVNGTSFYNTATNTFDKSTTNPFVLGYTANGCDMKLKYLAILNDNTTDLTASLMTRFGI